MEKTNLVHIGLSGVTNMEFELISSCCNSVCDNITCGPSSNGLGWKLAVPAERMDGESVRQWYSHAISTIDDSFISGASISNGSFENDVDFSFAFKGNLIFYIRDPRTTESKKYRLNDVVFAQASGNGAKGCWLIGGPNMRNVMELSVLAGIDNNQFICQTVSSESDPDHSRAVVFSSGGDSNWFNAYVVEMRSVS